MNLQPARLIGSALDSLVGIVSPRRGLARKAVRSAMYAAAQSPRTTGGWSPVDSDINAIIKNSTVPVRARIRQLVRDFPYFARAVNVLCDYTVGSGIVYQAAVKDAEGNFDRKNNQQIEDAWNYWADEADASGRLHLYEIMNLAKRQELESGEYFLALRVMKDKSRHPPLALQMFESDNSQQGHP
jgi:capsid protein